MKRGFWYCGWGWLVLLWLVGGKLDGGESVLDDGRAPRRLPWSVVGYESDG